VALLRGVVWVNEKKETIRNLNCWVKMTFTFTVMMGVLSFFVWTPNVEAKSSKRAKISMSVPNSVAKALVWNSNIHPKIVKVSPGPVKPGQKVRITGKNFGTKSCFRKVSFGSDRAKKFTVINDHTVEAVVPKLKPGIRSINILTAGGSSELVVLLKN